MARKPCRLAWIACCALAAGALAACGGEQGGMRSASCAQAVTWRGEAYAGFAGTDLPVAGAELRPPAKLSNGCGNEEGAPTPVTALRMGPVDPAVALWVRGQRAGFLHPGYFIALPSHPLHRAFFGTDGKPYNKGDGRRCRFAGSVTNVTPRDVTVSDDDPAGPRALVTIDARTDIRGFRRQGLPYLQTGDGVAVTGRRCRTGGRVQGITAARIVPG
jgi:hypothetical protein